MGCNKVFKRNSRALACIIWLNLLAGHNQRLSLSMNADSSNMSCYWFQYASRLGGLADLGVSTVVSGVST